ncbi:tyrosine-type recombinase/integrase [Lysinibacillus sp. CNPSo 3705]|uniref:tyrosine-type recombinase/integrase n=1 Tax=Lysinibacillus sp. CNPSo 3705 TaxID=3028148 RepID=UPI0023639A1E|nr:site-specific integrase [Lysinibacillus sp. CNPSo 3705]MDD1504567.1 tyrosine-type recombinase/integrase [Lysinibacillus sp. CNPSo 3705]
MNNITPLLDMSKNIWILPANDDLADYIFNFEFLPNEWFKKTIKHITRESIKIGRLKLSTLNRYNYSLERFFKFLKDNNYEFSDFSSITFEIVEEYVHYLLATLKSPSTRAVSMAALKHIIEFGQLFEIAGFPNIDVFDGTEYRTLQNEDTLKSTLISDDVLTQIDNALNEMASNLDELSFNEQTLWALITVLRHTGIRLSEALMLHEDCLRKDLMNKYLLEVVSEKNETERFIPINTKVVKAIKFLNELTMQIRSELGSNKLFFIYLVYKKKYNFLQQFRARQFLEKKFVEKYNITETSGQLVQLRFHQFRHQMGTDLINNGMSPFEVMQYLGHESMHSTRLYAKVRNDKLTSEYKKLGFIGLIKPTVSSLSDKQGNELSKEIKMTIQLPDGACTKPIEKKVANCIKPNACLFCPKFITTPEYLDIHKNHLKRLRADKLRYMGEDLFGNEYVLNQTEKTLEDIICRLESLESSEGNV